jgi:hypothetical protein
MAGQGLLVWARGQWMPRNADRKSIRRSLHVRCSALSHGTDSWFAKLTSMYYMSTKNCGNQLPLPACLFFANPMEKLSKHVLCVDRSKSKHVLYIDGIAKQKSKCCNLAFATGRSRPMTFDGSRGNCQSGQVSESRLVFF